MKRVWIWGLMLGLALSGCGSGTVEERPPEGTGTPVRMIGAEAADWREVYVEFLEELCEEEKQVRNMDRPDYDPNDYPMQVENLSKEYLLYDLDRDGVPEMVIRSNFYRSDIRVLTAKNGAAVEVGALDGRYMAFYTCPNGPGILVRETPKGPVFVFPLTLENGEIRQGAYLYETPEGVTWDEDFSMEATAPGAMYLRGFRTMVEWPEHAPLTLPIFDYGREEGAAELDPVRDETARSLILAALESGAAFCAVSGNGYGGDAGWTTLEDYLLPGGIAEYAEKPLVPRQRAWVDLDGDGQRECVLYVEHDEGDYIRSGYFVIFSEQEKAVYAYCLDLVDRMDIQADGVFVDPWYLEESIEGGVWRVSFRENQCYQYSAAYDAAVPTVAWETFD